MEGTKSLALAAVLVVGGLTALPANTEVGAVDDVPAATLLIPYFEVDLDDPGGVTTLVEYRSVSPQAQMTRITFWTDWGIPLFGVTEYLTGYDVVVFNVFDMLANGNFPITASTGQDPDDFISPQGPFSEDIDVPSCDPFYPYVNPLVDQATLEAIQAGYTGQDIGDGSCFGFDHGDRVARGYITIDVIRNCGFVDVLQPGYFVDGGAGEARNDNVLTGTWVLTDPVRGNVFAHAVALEADGAAASTTTPGNYTFYGREVDFQATDNREPLAASWAATAQAAGTELIVWRDQKLRTGPVACDAPFPPAPFPLGQEAVVAFDRDEVPTELEFGQASPIPFPLATQRVRVGEGDLVAPAKPGWLFLALSTTVGVVTDPAAQAHVTILQFPEQPDRTGTGSAATSLDSAADPLDFSTFPQPRQVR